MRFTAHDLADRPCASLALLLVVGCSGGPSLEVPEHSSPAPKPAIAPVVGHWMTVERDVMGNDGPNARYCNATGLTLKDGRQYPELRVAQPRLCGPFLSGFEAALVAGVTAGQVEEEIFATHDSPDDAFAGLESPYPRALFAAQSGEVLGRPMALVLYSVDIRDWSSRYALERREAGDGPGAQSTGPLDAELEDIGATLIEREIYSMSSGSPRSIARIPLLDQFESSRGLSLLVGPGAREVFIQVTGESRGPGRKSEKIVAWRYVADAREVLFEAPLLEWSRHPDGSPTSEGELRVTRVVPAEGGVDLVSYRIRFPWLPAAAVAVGEMPRVKEPNAYGVPAAELGTIERLGSTRHRLF